MSVEVRFEPIGLAGLIAEGTYLSDAARRMGISMPLDCARRGCVSCRVKIVSGAEILSSLTAAERNILSDAELALEHRLACQVRIDRSGEVVVHMIPEEEKKTEGDPGPNDIKKQFGELPLSKKIATLVQLEAVTISEALNSVTEKPVALGEKLFDKFYNKAKATEREAREKQKPPEHKGN